MPSNFLQALLDKIGSNLDASSDMLKKQTQLQSKRMDNPDYTPTPDEAANEQAYNKAAAGAVAGSLAPTEGLFGKAKSLVGEIPQTIAPGSVDEASHIINTLVNRNIGGAPLQAAVSERSRRMALDALKKAQGL